MTLFVALLCWVVLSVPAALVFGRILARAGARTSATIPRPMVRT